MRHFVSFLKDKSHWLLLFFITDLFFSFIVWLAAPSAMWQLMAILALFTFFALLAGYFIDNRRRRKQVAALMNFLNDTEDTTMAKLKEEAGVVFHPTIKSIYNILKEQNSQLAVLETELKNYREFIEEWTHEIKTPLSLITLVLSNHRAEITPYVFARMDHARHAISGSVDRVLYYARLNADHVDYQFEKIMLRECVEESLADFREIAEEKHIKLEINLPDLQAVSDKKILRFMLDQLLSNAVKYAPDEEGAVSVNGYENESGIHLGICNNGTAVPLEDIPFLFDKGFTGSHPGRQNATGIGLYMVKKYAEVLSVQVNIKGEQEEGFEIELVFPVTRV